MIDPAAPFQHPGQAAQFRAIGHAAAALVMQRRHVRVHVAGLAEPFRILITCDNGLYRAETMVPRASRARIFDRTDASEMLLVGSLVSAIMRETGTYRVHVECDGDADVPTATVLAQSVLAASRSGALTVEALHDLGPAGVVIADALVRFAAASRVIDPAAASVAPPEATPESASESASDGTPATSAPTGPTVAASPESAPEAVPSPAGAPVPPSRGRKPRPTHG